MVVYNNYDSSCAGYRIAYFLFFLFIYLFFQAINDLISVLQSDLEWNKTWNWQKIILQDWAGFPLESVSRDKKSGALSDLPCSLWTPQLASSSFARTTYAQPLASLLCHGWRMFLQIVFLYFVPFFADVRVVFSILSEYSMKYDWKKSLTEKAFHT